MTTAAAERESNGDDDDDDNAHDRDNGRSGQISDSQPGGQAHGLAVSVAVSPQVSWNSSRLPKIKP